MAHTLKHLQELQGLPLSLKISLTKQRIREWVNHYGTDGVYISFSGGKDSTVLLHLVRENHPDIPAVFFDTGLEYPEIREFVKGFENVEWIKPKKNFRQILEKYGYPFPSKEVSESVYGAKKYLTKVMTELDASATDRQTDRQTDRPQYAYFYRKLTGTGEYAKPVSHVQGADNKYRKVRGLGEYAKRPNAKPKRRSKSETGNTDGNADSGRSDKGEYP